MRRTTKGAFAAATGAVLLMGGAGTLAFWSDDTDVPGGSITSGQLALGTPDCGTGWTLDDDTPLGAGLIVPGDVLTKSCTIDVTATGTHMVADLGIDPAGWTATNDLTAELDVEASFLVDGAASTEITSAQAVGPADIEVDITVTFDGPSATNASQDLTAALDAITVTATQTHS